MCGVGVQNMKEKQIEIERMITNNRKTESEMRKLK